MSGGELPGEDEGVDELLTRRGRRRRGRVSDSDALKPAAERTRWNVSTFGVTRAASYAASAECEVSASAASSRRLRPAEPGTAEDGSDVHIAMVSFNIPPGNEMRRLTRAGRTGSRVGNSQSSMFRLWFVPLHR